MRGQLSSDILRVQEHWRGRSLGVGGDNSTGAWDGTIA